MDHSRFTASSFRLLLDIKILTAFGSRFTRGVSRSHKATKNGLIKTKPNSNMRSLAQWRGQSHIRITILALMKPHMNIVADTMLSKISHLPAVKASSLLSCIFHIDYRAGGRQELPRQNIDQRSQSEMCEEFNLFHLSSQSNHCSARAFFFWLFFLGGVCIT